MLNFYRIVSYFRQLHLHFCPCSFKINSRHQAVGLIHQHLLIQFNNHVYFTQLPT